MRDFSRMTREQLEQNYDELERAYNALHFEAAASAREATSLRAVIAKVRECLSTLDLMARAHGKVGEFDVANAIDTAIAAVGGVLPKEGVEGPAWPAIGHPATLGRVWDHCMADERVVYRVSLDGQWWHRVYAGENNGKRVLLNHPDDKKGCVVFSSQRRSGLDHGWHCERVNDRDVPPKEE